MKTNVVFWHGVQLYEAYAMFHLSYFKLFTINLREDCSSCTLYRCARDPIIMMLGKCEEHLSFHMPAEYAEVDRCINSSNGP